MRRPRHDGQKPLPLQLNATSRLSLHARTSTVRSLGRAARSPCTRPAPCARRRAVRWARLRRRPRRTGSPGCHARLRKESTAPSVARRRRARGRPRVRSRRALRARAGACDGAGMTVTQTVRDRCGRGPGQHRGRVVAIVGRPGCSRSTRRLPPTGLNQAFASINSQGHRRSNLSQPPIPAFPPRSGGKGSGSCWLRPQECCGSRLRNDGRPTGSFSRSPPCSPTYRDCLTRRRGSAYRSGRRSRASRTAGA